MLTVGDRFPAFRLKAVVSSDLDDAFQEVTEHSAPDRWKVFVFYPKDFTFVCPTELAGFAELHADFQDRDAQVFAASTDSEFVHLAWRRQHPALRDLPYPMLSDIRKDLSATLGILDRDERVCMRATFVVDPEGTIRFASVNDGSVGRSPEEVLRVLDALQTGELTACNWRRGEQPLQVS
ncbi:MAG: peroxiredoxin [Planctomycetota bacterium]|jgi:peroxiredoxin (alkyl hydroperoxide reductase subunit C)